MSRENLFWLIYVNILSQGVVLLFFIVEVSILIRLFRLHFKRPTFVIVTCAFLGWNIILHVRELIFFKLPPTLYFYQVVGGLMLMTLSILGAWQMKKWGFALLALAFLFGEIVNPSVRDQDFIPIIIFVPLALAFWKYITHRLSPKLGT